MNVELKLGVPLLFMRGVDRDCHCYSYLMTLYTSFDKEGFYSPLQAVKCELK